MYPGFPILNILTKHIPISEILPNQSEIQNIAIKIASIQKQELCFDDLFLSYALIDHMSVKYKVSKLMQPIGSKIIVYMSGRRVELNERCEKTTSRYAKNMFKFFLILQIEDLKSRKIFNAPLFSIHDKGGKYVGSLYPSSHYGTPYMRSHFPAEIMNIFKKSSIVIFEQDPNPTPIYEQITSHLQGKLINNLEPLIKHEQSRLFTIKSNAAYHIIQDKLVSFEKMINELEKILKAIKKFNFVTCIKNANLQAIKNHVSFLETGLNYFFPVNNLQTQIQIALKWLLSQGNQNKENTQQLMSFSKDLKNFDIVQEQLSDYMDFLKKTSTSVCEHISSYFMYGIESTLVFSDLQKPMLELNDEGDKQRIAQATKNRVVTMKDMPSGLNLIAEDSLCQLDRWSGWYPEVVNDDNAFIRGPQDYAKVLLDDMNIKWAEKISNFIKNNPKKLFFATVGFNHLTGKCSLLKFLQEKGLVIKTHDPYTKDLASKIQ